MVHGELWGITAEGWVAIATIFSGFAVLASGVAILYGIIRGARQFLGEQEARDVRRYLLDEGTWKLTDSLERILQTVRLNYGQCLHLLRLVRDLPAGNAGAPRPENLPRLFPMNPQDFAFASIRAVSHLLNSMDLGRVATSALAKIYSTNAIFTHEIEQIVRTYYSGELVLSDEQRADLVERFNNLATRKYNEAEKFSDLPGWLEDAGLRVQEMRITRFDEIDRVQKDPKIVELMEKVKAMRETLDMSDGEE